MSRHDSTASSPSAPENSADDDDDVESFTSRYSRIKVEPKESYSKHLAFIDNFLLNKSRLRTDIINKKREFFGDYKDCCGLTKRSVYFNEKERGVFSLRYSSNGRRLVVGFGSGTVKLYDTESEDKVNTVVHGKETRYPITCARFLHENNDVFYVSSAEGLVLRYDILNDDLSAVIRQSAQCEINTIDININNANLLTGSSCLDVKVYDLNNCVLLSTYKNMKKHTGGRMEWVFPEFHTNRVFAVKFLPGNANVFLSGGWDNKLKLWDLRTKFGYVNTISGPHISGDAIDVKGNLLLVGSWEPKNSLYLIDVREFKFLEYIHPINCPKALEGVYTYAAAFHSGDSSGDIILRASLGHKSLDVISIKQKVILNSYISEKSSVALDSYGTDIAFGGMHNVFSIVKFFPNLFVEHSERARLMTEVGEEGEETEMEEETEVGSEEV